MNVSEDDYVFVTLAEGTNPTKGVYFQLWRDAWWAVHPEKGLVFYNPVYRSGRRQGHRREIDYGSPVCNTTEAIARKLIPVHLSPPIEIRQIPKVWVPINLSDYRE